MMLAISRNKDPKASAPYLSLLKLSRPPFLDHAGEAFFYADPQRAQHLDMLQHLAQYSDEVLLVSGEAGSGKTELLERFLERAEEHWRTCRLEGGERLEADRLFSRIAECFQLNLADGGGNLLETMQSQLSALQEQQLPILLIDDAQALSDDALEIVMHLAVLEGEHGKLIRVVMFADPTLEERLVGERFTSMPQPHRQELQGLDEEQAIAYLEHRLHAAGYQGPALFSDRDVKQMLRETAGLPGRLNAAAHQLLSQMLVQRRPKVNVKRYLQMGAAASAVIGTVLGLNERINTFLSGSEPKVMTVSAPERPVVRLADEGNPWAVVIRDGESIQINCGAPGGSTVGVRPLMTAAVDTGGAVPMGQPIMQDVTPVESKAAPKHAEGNNDITAQKSEQTGGKPSDTVATPKDSGEQTSEKSKAPVQVASNDVSEPQLVVKPDEKKAETTAKKQDVEKPKVPVEVKLDEVEPSPVPTGDVPTKIMLKGSGFQPGSKVAVSHAGKVQVLPREKVHFVSSGQIGITIVPGKQASDWAAQVSTPDNHRSNVLRFRVESKPVVETVTEKAPTIPKPVPAKSVSKAGTKQQSAAKVKKPVAKPAAKNVARPPEKAVKTAGVNGYSWYASQPKTHYTLQLLASEQRGNAETYAKQHGLKAPVGEFAMERNGKTLYAVTQGSYSSRAAAEKAAAGLPSGTKPWIRSMESVQQVMKREKPATKTSVAPAASGEHYKDTAWVWSQNPNHFTVQLSAAGSEEAIMADMHRINLPGELSVVQAQRDGKPWYALVYGSFPSKEAALGTIARLPADLKKAGPWPRSFASLQDEISRSTPAQ